MQLFRSSAAWPVFAVLLLGALAGCGNHLPPRVLPDSVDPDAPNKALQLYDTNHDGAISGAELDNAPGLKAALPFMDENKTGKITAEDIAKRIAFWKETENGRVYFLCTVHHKNEPLVGATVRFVPEKFLGEGLQAGTGTTNKYGAVPVIKSHSEAAAAINGLSPGMYRVEITKAGEAIPAKYNTATTLGVLVDRDSIKITPDFNLDY